MGHIESQTEVEKLRQDHNELERGIGYIESQTEVEKLRQDHNELQRGMGHIESQTEVEKLRQDHNELERGIGYIESQTEVEKLRQDHNELERGIGHIESQLRERYGAHRVTTEVEKLRQDHQRARERKGQHRVTTEVEKLRQDHNELERGIGHIKSQLRWKSLDKIITSWRENILIDGIKQKESEDIWEVLDNFFVKELGIEKFKAESFPIENAHQKPQLLAKTRPNAIIGRFMHYSDKQLIMENAYKVANKKIRVVDDLPVITKEARNDLAKVPYKIRTDKKLQTRIKVRGIVLVLETRLNSKDVWNTRKTINCVR
ncbi:unnamed protein product [Mytilus coruscus]|uniref:Uncharacterized protein n=1 Tax=Mytilus coruscus TaxID=42192 RepID=A0A6J8DLB3_MYTCO|nr:unnamed protein product [Mytilus coruscus]